MPGHEPTSRRTSAATLGSPTLAMSVGGTRALPAAADRIHVSKTPLTAAVSANTSGWSHSTDVSTARSGRYGSKLPAYSSASTTNGPEPQRAVAGTPPVTDVGSSAPTNAAGSAPAATSVCTSQPEVVLFPCVPATATSVRPNAASATTCCHGSSGIRADRAAASSGWSGSTAVRALVTASRCGGWGPLTCAGSWAQASGIPAASRAGVYCDGPPGSQPLTTPPARWARRAAALAPAPAAPTTWIRSPATIGRVARARARPDPTAAASRVTSRAVRAAARAPRPRCRACSPSGRRTTGGGGRRHLPDRPRRRTSAPRASRRSRRRVRRCR